MQVVREGECIGRSHDAVEVSDLIRFPDGFSSHLIDEMGGIRIQGVLWHPRVSAAPCKVAWDHRGISR